MTKFTSVQDAFNFYRTKSIAEMEKRATEMKAIIETDPDVDIKAMNIELTGLNEAKANATENATGEAGEARSMNPITGLNMANDSVEAVKGDVYASKEYRSAFFKSLLGRELNGAETRAMNRAMEIEKRADNYTTSSNTAVVLPTATLNEVIAKARKEGGLLARCRAFAMPSNISIPVGTPSSKAIWSTEGKDATADTPQIVEVAFNGYEIIKLFSISAKVKTMSIDAFEAYLVDELNNCVLECLADGIVNGTGTNQGAGLETITWTAGTNLVETNALAYANFPSAMAMLKRGYHKKAVWAMNSATLYNGAYNIVDTNKRPIFLADVQKESIGSILGHEVVIDDNIADGVIYYGNFDYMGYNLPAGIAVESSTQSSFRSGKVDYRGLAIADCKPIVSEAFVKIAVKAG